MHASRADVVGLKTTWPCSSLLASHGKSPPDNYANGTRDVRWKCRENSSRDCASRIPPRCFSLLRCRSLTAARSYSLVALLLSVTDSKVEALVTKQSKNGRDTTLARIYSATEHLFLQLLTYALFSRNINIFIVIDAYTRPERAIDVDYERVYAFGDFYRIHATINYRCLRWTLFIYVS